MSFYSPWMLLFLPLAFLPLLLERHHSRAYSWLEILPGDPLSNLIGIMLKVLASIALLFIIVGIASPHTAQQQIPKVGEGAQLALIMDRSASMDDPFSGSSNGKAGETKSQAASRLMTQFVKQRKNDMFGMITFSNSATYVLPLTQNREAVLAAVQAAGGAALFQTNIGAGLSSGTSLFEKVPDSGSRAIILLSDGGGHIGADAQQRIRDWLDKYRISLYWIVLRTPGGISIFDETIKETYKDRIPPVEIELYDYFKTLRSPFHAYEAEDPKTLALAIEDINQKERKPIRYFEEIPGKDYSPYCFFLAALMIGLLLGVKYLEVRTWH